MMRSKAGSTWETVNLLHRRRLYCLLVMPALSRRHRFIVRASRVLHPFRRARPIHRLSFVRHRVHLCCPLLPIVLSVRAHLHRRRLRPRCYASQRKLPIFTLRLFSARRPRNCLRVNTFALAYSSCRATATDPKVVSGTRNGSVRQTQKGQSTRPSRILWNRG